MPSGANSEPLGMRKRGEPAPGAGDSLLAAAGINLNTGSSGSAVGNQPERKDSERDRRDRRSRSPRERSSSYRSGSGRDERRRRSRSSERNGRESRRSRSKEKDERRRRRFDEVPDAPIFGPILPPPSIVNVGMPGFSPKRNDYLAPNTPGTPNSDEGIAEDGKKKRKSRWSKENEKAFVPGMPTMIPSNITEDQRKAYLLQLQIEDISRKLRTSDFGIPANPEERSPSPEPVYDTHGKRLNTREVRTRQKLESNRHQFITELIKINPHYKPPHDYKPPINKLHGKVWIPQDDNPEINFVGLLIGPRGNTLKQLEKETGSRIIIRGKGSVKEGKIAKRDGPLPGEDEPLHAYITATDQEAIDKAIAKINEMIEQALEIPDQQNELRKVQLRQLALLNGTLRGDELALSSSRCSNCGANTHKSWDCPDRPNVTANIYCSACGNAGHIAKDCKNSRPGEYGGGGPGSALDDEYSALMAELGQGDGERGSKQPIMRINLAKPKPTPLVGTGSTPIPPPWMNSMGPPMPPPWNWMPPGMPMPPMPHGMGGMMPPPPPPPPPSSGSVSGSDNNDSCGIPPPPGGPSDYSQGGMGSMSMPPMMMGWPPMMPPQGYGNQMPTQGYGNQMPPPPPPCPMSSSNDAYFAGLLNAGPPPPPPPPPS